jgi:membrane-bound lytic murein transglycosylase D
MWRIAQRYGTTPAAIAAASGRSVHEVLYPGDRLTVVPGAVASNGATGSEGASATIVYTVRRGDTLSTIGQRHGTSSRAIARASGISVRSTIHPGDRLRIPSSGGATAGAPTTVQYTVRRGDSLWRIATRHRTSIEAICRENGISREATLHPGTRLSIPLH